MSFQNRLKKTLNNLPEHFPKGAELLKHFSDQIQSYEEQLKNLVSELDTKSRDAREKSQERLERLLDQAKTTRRDLEKRVAKLVDSERKRLNTNLTDFVTFLKSVSGKEKTASTRKRASGAKKTSTTRKKKVSVKRAARPRASVEATTYA